MKYFIFLFTFYFIFPKIDFGQTFSSLNISLRSYISPETDTTGHDGRKYSGCWGWYQSDKQKEYALVGTSSGTYFIDVTNPGSPIIRDYVTGRRKGCTWREIKSYQNYCYIVSDDQSPNSFQIVDMQYLPDSVHVVYDDTTYFERCHTIFIDQDKLYCGYATPKTGQPSSMRVYSLVSPTAPVLLRKLEDDYPNIMWAHDMFVRNDTIYASCGNQGFFVFKLQSNLTFTALAQYSGYPQSGYNHSSWQTDDRKTMVFTDEVPAGLSAKVIDVSDLNNITLIDTIRSHYGATAHNPYIVENSWCWISSYQDGIYLYDISDPSNTSIYGYFDTHPQHGTNDFFSTDAYRGNWGAYPYLPSKIIIALDMQNGLFILQGDNYYQSTVGIKDNTFSIPSSFSLQPNPAQNQLEIIIANNQLFHFDYIITDMLGHIIKSDFINSSNIVIKENIPISDLNSGCYFFTLTHSNGYSETKKIIIQH